MSNLSESYDVVTIGETMLRMTPDGYSRLEQADSLQVHVGGSESNTAVGLARLGNRVAWLSRLPANFLGHRIEQAIAAQGVDTQHVIWTDQDRVGLYFLEVGSPPRQSKVIYDRANSAFARMSASELPRELFQPQRARWLHVTGISMWLSSTVRDVIHRAVELARLARWKVSFDVNHRALLCPANDARTYCEQLFLDADLVFLPKRDALNLWQLDPSSSDESLLKSLVSMRHGKPTMMTLGDRGAMAADNTQSVFQDVEPVTPIGRLGGGDAFSAGFLCAWLEGKDLAHSLRWATATARLKYSVPGDLPLIDRREVESLVEGNLTGSLER